jgi:anaphase-promoting complex subunit 8
MAPLPPSPTNVTSLPQAYLHPASKDPTEAALEVSELSSYLLAKSYFDVHEYDRASFVLAKCKSGKSRFLHLYALYIAGEKRRDEDSEMVLGPLDGAATQNKECSGILSTLEPIMSAKEQDGGWCEDDSWLLFLYGIILQKQKNDEEARKAFIKSVNLYPYNWSAWQELGATICTLTEVRHLLPTVSYFPGTC